MKRNLMFVLSLLACSIMMAGPVTLEEAQRKAAAFVQSRGGGNLSVDKQRMKSPRVEEVLSDDAFFVFNVGSNDGFVIVSGDDRTEPILGYSDAGSIDPRHVPSNVRAWLEHYANEMKWMDEHPSVANSARQTARKLAFKNKIDPLIQTRWNQGNPYNIYCPLFLNGNKSVTGCVATAMAQVLYYVSSHHDGFPAATTQEIPGYLCDRKWNTGDGTQQVSVSAVPVTTFDWVNMSLTYTGNEGAQEAKSMAVAKLMQCCGASVNMDYADDYNNGSSASTAVIPHALKTYFGFDGSVQYRTRSKYAKDWEDIIYAELAAGRPVIYSGQKPNSGGGHAFICDGYDADGYFHINWGWGGNCDGHFLLSVANPYNDGNANNGYSDDQEIVIGLQAPTGVSQDEEVRLTVEALTIMPSITSSDNTVWPISSQNLSSYFLFGCNYKYSNNLSDTYDIDYAIGIYDENHSLLQVIAEEQQTDFKSGTWYEGWRAATIEYALAANKTYYFIPLSRKTGDETWLEMYDADKHYIKATTTASTVTFTDINPTTSLIAVYDADGNATFIDASEDFVVPATTTAVDLRGCTTLASITPSSNLNCIYLFDAEQEVPAGLTNVVKGGHAESITLTDGYNFSSPISFTADKISYSRTNELAANGTGGWSTIVLPYNVTRVTADGEAIDWFHSASDTNKNFWLKSFTSDSEGKVNFSYANSFDANTPYIIALPGDKWGEAWNLTGKTIVFEGEDVLVESQDESYTAQTNYLFSGSTRSQTVNNVYALNAGGSAFSKQASYTADAFRAYFSAKGSASSSYLKIGSDDGQTTGIKSLGNETKASADVYDIHGIKVGTDKNLDQKSKGIYIINGKKIIK